MTFKKGDEGMNQKQPIGIKWISYFQFFGVIAVLMTINIEQTPALNVRFGVPFLPELLVKILIIVFGTLIAYGYLKQTKWGFFSMLGYSILFGGVSSFLGQSQPFTGNAIYAFIVAVYTLVHFKDFNITFK